jgi:predicted RNA binding protein YcfA (HicA-like mRNA interferase family)
MPPLPLLKPSQVVKAFENLGWEIARQKGSHIIMTREGHIATLSILKHKEIARGTLRGLIKRAGLSIEELIESI